MSLCFCGRQARGFAWHPFEPEFHGRQRVQCCSMTCLDIVTARSGDMSLNMDEKRAINAVSPRIGEYLDNLGKTDLATMTEAEWLGFLAHAYECVSDEVRSIWAREVPF